MTYERSRANLKTRKCLRVLADSWLIQDVSMTNRERTRRVLRRHAGFNQIVLEYKGRLADLASSGWAFLAEVLVKQRELSDWPGQGGSRRND
mgnify:CR=1 FL=1